MSLVNFNYDQRTTTVSKKSTLKRGSNTRKAKSKGSSPFWIDPITARTWNVKKELEDLSQDVKDRLEYWDSVLEWKIYQAICKVAPEDKVIRHPGLDILPKTNQFPAWKWNVDFGVDCGDEDLPVLIEAKGLWLLNDDCERRVFIQTMRLLSITNHEQFERVLLIGDSTWNIPSTGLVVHDYNELPDLLWQYRIQELNQDTNL
ncbi:hypothetical protein [Scytonema sp. NUACC26]|uniref:hypothetical protein n=1 Tax=Scytonema sp. NUACC26 TaxID=3140176 RepID=UPI0034DC3034